LIRERFCNVMKRKIMDRSRYGEGSIHLKKLEIMQ
jgi:hypothetical protein